VYQGPEEADAPADGSYQPAGYPSAQPAAPYGTYGGPDDGRWPGEDVPAGPPPSLAGYPRGAGDGPPPRPRRRLLWLAGLAAAVLVVVAYAVWPSGSSHPAANDAGSGPAAAARASGKATAPPARASAAPPAVTAAAAQQILDHYMSVNNQANRDFSSKTLSGIEGGAAYRMDANGYVFTLTALRMGTAQAYPELSFAGPSFYIPRLASYPHWFVTRGTWTDLTGPKATAPGYLLFDQAGPGQPWLVVNEPNLTGGSTPQIALSGGYAQAVSASTASELVVSPASLPQDTASQLDGQQTAGFSLTGVGSLQDQHDKLFWQARLPSGSTASLKHTPAGSVFALRTTGGGALVFYAENVALTLTGASSAQIPGYHAPGGPSTVTVPYNDLFAVVDPPRTHPGPVTVVAEQSGI
jgi:hypothetical protein